MPPGCHRKRRSGSPGLDDSRIARHVVLAHGATLSVARRNRFARNADRHRPLRPAPRLNRGSRRYRLPAEPGASTSNRQAGGCGGGTRAGSRRGYRPYAVPWRDRVAENLARPLTFPRLRRGPLPLPLRGEEVRARPPHSSRPRPLPSSPRRLPTRPLRLPARHLPATGPGRPLRLRRALLPAQAQAPARSSPWRRGRA